MAHNKVYGICEDKCQVEVFSKDEANERYDGKADSNHASNQPTYGIGTATNYGHVKLTDSTAQPSGSLAGVALAGTVGYSLAMQIKNAKQAMQIPVNGIFFSFQRYENESSINELLGYGTWNYFGSFSNTTEKITMYAYARVS